MKNNYTFPSFHYLWRDELSLSDVVPINHTKAEPFRKIAERTYDYLVKNGFDKGFDKGFDEGFDEGFEDGKKEMLDSVKEKFTNILNNGGDISCEELEYILNEF